MKNKDIVIYKKPSLSHPRMIAAFHGWGDVTQAGTFAISYLVTKLKAKEFAIINAEEFYDFPANRPIATISHGLIQSVKMPDNHFYYAKERDGTCDIILLIGIEPNLKWHRFVNATLDFADKLGVEQIYLLGSLYDEVSHTMNPRITGVTSQHHLTQTLKEHHIEALDYHGQSSIYSLILAACKQRGKEAINLWGHIPFYIRAENNPVTCLALLARLVELLPLGLDLHDMEAAASHFSGKLDKLVVENPELKAYVQTLEKQYKTKRRAAIKDIGSSDKIIKELESFLKKEGGEGGISL